MTIENLYNIYKQYPSVCTDTRKIKQGDIYFALKGENFDGNKFAADALNKGASYAVIDNPEFNVSSQYILVENVLNTLQQLALHHRKTFSIPFIAITGSNGKTTTKELIAAVMSSQYKVYYTEGNLNNHIGVPLTILKIKTDADFAIIEMGANHREEIKFYCTMALPTHGLITNCGKAHLEGFGSIEGVKKAKGELYDYLRANNGTAFVCSDYDYLLQMSEGIKQIITYGENKADIVGHCADKDFMVNVKIENDETLKLIQSNLVGNYNLPNILAAVAVGKYFKVDGEKIKTGIENYIPTSNRSQMVEWKTNKIIMDAYNANPSSMQQAIKNFAGIENKNKILILGAMAELGDSSQQEHEQLLQLVDEYNFDKVFLVGDGFKNCITKFKKFSSVNELKLEIEKNPITNSLILIKGSRKEKLETLLNEKLLMVNG